MKKTILPRFKNSCLRFLLHRWIKTHPLTICQLSATPVKPTTRMCTTYMTQYYWTQRELATDSSYFCSLILLMNAFREKFAWRCVPSATWSSATRSTWETTPFVTWRSRVSSGQSALTTQVSSTTRALLWIMPIARLLGNWLSVTWKNFHLTVSTIHRSQKPKKLTWETKSSPASGRNSSHTSTNSSDSKV